MEYTNENRGTIQHKSRARQVISFDGLRRNNITPTDIDGGADYHQNAYLFFELKYRQNTLPNGQAKFYTSLVDALEAAGKDAVFLICEHHVDDCEEDVQAAKAICHRYYRKGRWEYLENKTLGDVYHSYFSAMEEKEEQQHG